MRPSVLLVASCSLTASPGGAVCTFVPDEHPRHAGGHTLNVKLLRTVEDEPIRPNPAFPANLRHLVRPLKPGMLLPRKQQPWQLDTDACVPRLGEGFGVLFENASLPPIKEGGQRRTGMRAMGEKLLAELERVNASQTDRLADRSRRS